MYGDGVSVVKFVKLGKVEDALSLIKEDGHQIFFGVDVLDDADVSVVYAHAASSVFGFPFHGVVVLDLHDAVTNAEYSVPGLAFGFFRRRGIQRILQCGVRWIFRDS